MIDLQAVALALPRKEFTSVLLRHNLFSLILLQTNRF